MRMTVRIRYDVCNQFSSKISYNGLSTSNNFSSCMCIVSTHPPPTQRHTHAHTPQKDKQTSQNCNLVWKLESHPFLSIIPKILSKIPDP